MEPDLLLIDSADEIDRIAKLLKNSTRMVALDTEFVRETTFFPKLELMQLATLDQVWLIDIQAFKDRQIELKPILDVLKDPNIVKVAHAAYADQECLYHELGILASPLLDTALAASLCGYGDGIGLANFIHSTLGKKIKKGHSRTNWSVRPLPVGQLEYAASDVTYLVEASEIILGELERLDRKEWAFELSSKWNNSKIYQSNPTEIANRLYQSGKIDEKDYPTLLNIVRWREARVRELNVPRRWLADDSVLLDLARVKPKSLKQLMSFRGLNKGEVKKNSSVLLDVVLRPKDEEVRPPRVKRVKPASKSESRVIDVMKSYVAILADKHRLAARHLISGGDYLAILRSGAKNFNELVEEELLSQGAAKLVGDEILALLSGKRTLSIRDKSVQIRQSSDI